MFAGTDEAVLISGGLTGIRRYDLNSDSWSPALTDVRRSLAHVSFETRDRGYATAHGALSITEDGGSTWSAQSPTPPLDELIVTAGGLWITSPAYCTSRCPPYIYRSDDQGKSWQPVSVPSRQKASGFQATDAMHAWYSAEDGLWRTQDGGVNWAIIDADSAAPTKGYRFIDADHGWREVCSAPDCTSSSFALTSDGGDTWQPRPPPRGVIVARVFTPLTAFGFPSTPPACHCPDRMLKTGDGGLTWTDVGNTESLPALASMTFFDDVHGVGLGSRKERSLPDTLFETDDGGASWRPHELPPLYYPIGELLARDGRVWFLTGLSESPFPGNDRQLIYRRDVFAAAVASPRVTADPHATSTRDREPLLAGLVAALAAAALLAGIALLLRRHRARA